MTDKEFGKLCAKDAAGKASADEAREVRIEALRRADREHAAAMGQD